VRFFIINEPKRQKNLKKSRTRNGRLENPSKRKCRARKTQQTKNNRSATSDHYCLHDEGEIRDQTGCEALCNAGGERFHKTQKSGVRTWRAMGERGKNELFLSSVEKEINHKASQTNSN